MDGTAIDLPATGKRSGTEYSDCIRVTGTLWVEWMLKSSGTLGAVRIGILQIVLSRVVLRLRGYDFHISFIIFTRRMECGTTSFYEARGGD